MFFIRYGCFKRCLLYVMNVSKTSFVHYGCLKRCLLHVVDVSKDVFYTLWLFQKMSFVRCGCLKDVFCTSLMFKDVFCTLLMFLKRHFLNVMNVSLNIFLDISTKAKHF